MTIFYHVTAAANVPSIYEHGLLLSEAYQNQYGINEGYDPDEQYNTSDKPENLELKRIFLCITAEEAEFFKSLLEDSHGVEAVILSVELNPANVERDVEDPEISVCVNYDIPAEKISFFNVRHLINAPRNTTPSTEPEMTDDSDTEHSIYSSASDKENRIPTIEKPINFFGKNLSTEEIIQKKKQDADHEMEDAEKPKATLRPRKT